jgi:hypothetical protein
MVCDVTYKGSIGIIIDYYAHLEIYYITHMSNCDLPAVFS